MKHIKLNLFFTICFVSLNSDACLTMHGFKKTLSKMELQKLENFITSHKDSKCKYHCGYNTVVCTKKQEDIFRL